MNTEPNTVGSVGQQPTRRANRWRVRSLVLCAAVALTLASCGNSDDADDEAAGYDPAAAVTLWEKMGKLGGSPPEFLSTHPSPENRAARLKQLAVQVQPLYAAAKERKGEPVPSFLSAREGMNERTVTKPGEMTREEYAAKAASEAETMTFLAEPFEVRSSRLVVPDRPGSGIEWNESAIRRYAYDA